MWMLCCSINLIIVPIVFCFRPILWSKNACVSVEENGLTFRMGASEEFLDMDKLRTEYYVLEGKGEIPGNSCEITLIEAHLALNIF